MSCDFNIKNQEIERIEKTYQKELANLLFKVEALSFAIDRELINNEAFTGAASAAVKSYFEEVHLTLLKSISVTAQSMLENSSAYRSGYGNIDSDENFILNKAAMADFDSQMYKDAEAVYNCTNEINRILLSISDIFPCGKVSADSVLESHVSIRTKIKELSDNVDSYEDQTVKNFDESSGVMLENLEKGIKAMGLYSGNIVNYQAGSFFKNQDVAKMTSDCAKYSESYATNAAVTFDGNYATVNWGQVLRLYLKDKMTVGEFVDFQSALMVAQDKGEALKSIVDGINFGNYPGIFESNFIRYHIPDFFRDGTREGVFDQLFDVLDFDRDEQGIFHVNIDEYSNLNFPTTEKTREFLTWISAKTGFKLSDIPGMPDEGMPGTWQQLGGYMTLYDTVFDFATDMKKQRYVFEDTSGNAYTLWLWKGDYLNLGAGGESGIYVGDASGDSQFNWVAVDPDLRLPMTLNIDYGDGNSSTYSSETWWATSFNPNEPMLDAEDITIEAVIDFSEHPEMWEGLCKKYDDAQRNNADDFDGMKILKEDKKVVIVY